MQRVYSAWGSAGELKETYAEIHRFAPKNEASCVPFDLFGIVPDED